AFDDANGNADRVTGAEVRIVFLELGGFGFANQGMHRWGSCGKRRGGDRAGESGQTGTRPPVTVDAGAQSKGEPLPKATGKSSFPQFILFPGDVASRPETQPVPLGLRTEPESPAT